MIESFLNSVVGNSSFPILIFATLISSIAFFPILMPLFSKKRDYKGKHVFISGGSTGIGLSLAHEFLLLGANVTLVARTQLKLEKAVEELQDLARARNLPGRVQAFSADVTAYSEVGSAVARAEASFGSIAVAVCCAGASYPGRFLEQDVQLFEKSMQLDYFGTLYLVKAVLPGMVSRNAGQLLFIASPLAAIGFVGYSTYCPAKFAVRGLADVLRNELAGTAVKISIGYPLDTDTPGFANEALTKPKVTEAISRFAGGEVYSSEKIAKSLVDGLRRGEYHIRTPELLVNLLLSSMSSTTPRSYPLLLEMFLAPLVVALLAVYRKILDRFVQTMAADRGD